MGISDNARNQLSGVEANLMVRTRVIFANEVLLIPPGYFDFISLLLLGDFQQVVNTIHRILSLWCQRL